MNENLIRRGKEELTIIIRGQVKEYSRKAFVYIGN